VKTSILALLFTAATSSPAAETVWLDSLDLSAMRQGWGTPQVNRSIRETLLSIGGQKSERDVGTSPAMCEAILRVIQTERVCAWALQRILSGQRGSDVRPKASTAKSLLTALF